MFAIYNNMRILFYGGKGWIGQLIYTEWKNKFDDELIISEIKVNPNNLTEVENELQTVKPDRVVCTLGRTYGYDETSGKFINNIDYLENHLRENVNDNMYSPMLLAILCQKLNIHLTYLGTGCIFSEDTRTQRDEYTESSVPDFFGSGYSVVKGYTDQLIKHFDNVANIRIRMPIVPENNSRNFITKILSYSKICSMPNSMTYLPDFVPIMTDMCLNGDIGTINCTNKGTISHKEIFELYTECTKKEHKYELIDEVDLNSILKSKRSNNILDTKKIENKYNVRHIKDCMRELFQ
jgi:3,5-epimerase/4-reductase